MKVRVSRMRKNSCSDLVDASETPSGSQHSSTVSARVTSGRHSSVTPHGWAATVMTVVSGYRWVSSIGPSRRSAPVVR